MWKCYKLRAVYVKYHYHFYFLIRFPSIHLDYFTSTYNIYKLIIEMMKGLDIFLTLFIECLLIEITLSLRCEERRYIFNTDNGNKISITSNISKNKVFAFRSNCCAGYMLEKDICVRKLHEIVFKIFVRWTDIYKILIRLMLINIIFIL